MLLRILVTLLVWCALGLFVAAGLGRITRAGDDVIDRLAREVQRRRCQYCGLTDFCRRTFVPWSKIPLWCCLRCREWLARG